MIRNKTLFILSNMALALSLPFSAYAIDLTQMSLKDIKAKAETGDNDAQYVLGSLFEDGMDVERNISEALKLYLKAGEQGNRDAQLRLGEAYYGGFGKIKQNFEESKKH